MSKKFQIAIAIALLAVVGAVLLPSLLPAPTTSGVNACLANLRQLDGATQQWVLENRKTTNDAPTWQDIEPYLLHGRKSLICDRGGTYTLGRLGKLPTCSYPGHSIQ